MTISDLSLEIASSLEPSDSFDGVVSQHQNAVRDYLANNGIATKSKLIGSLQRKTRIKPRENGDFDIDILVEIGVATTWVQNGLTPDGALTYLASGLASSSRYSEKNPIKDSPTVLFSHGDGIKVELVPAWKDMIGYYANGSPTMLGRGYWVPKNGRWELAEYDFIAEYLTRKNGVSDDLLVPTIKLLKALRRKYFPAMSSVFLEILAANMIPMWVLLPNLLGNRPSYLELTYRFVQWLNSNMPVRAVIPDSFEQAIVLDPLTYLNIKAGIASLVRQMALITLMSSESVKISSWKRLFS